MRGSGNRLRSATLRAGMQFERAEVEDTARRGFE
jgi:hypothetical protein